MEQLVTNEIFPSLTGNGRVWIFASNRILTAEEQQLINTRFDEFCQDWSAHGSRLKAAFQIFENQMLVLGADEDFEPASGCSIDRSTSIFQGIEQALNLDLFNRLNLIFKTPAGVQVVHTSKLKDAYNSHVIDDDSTFFDNSINTLLDLRTRWMVPLKKSWVHAKVNR